MSTLVLRSNFTTLDPGCRLSVPGLVRSLSDGSMTTYEKMPASERKRFRSMLEASAEVPKDDDTWSKMALVALHENIDHPVLYSSPAVEKASAFMVLCKELSSCNSFLLDSPGSLFSARFFET